MSLDLGLDIPTTLPSDISLRMQHRKSFDMWHLASERSNHLFRHLHPAFTKALDEIDDPKHADIFLDGVGLYEAVSTLLNPSQEGFSDLTGQAAVLAATEFARLHLPYELLDEASQSLDEALDETPQLMRFGREVLDRYAGNNPWMLGYGLQGLALTRRYHMSTLAAKAKMLSEIHGSDSKLSPEN